MPYAAIRGLQNAFKTRNKIWLGEDTERWKSVYLTECDTLLLEMPLRTKEKLINAVHFEVFLIFSHGSAVFEKILDFRRYLYSNYCYLHNGTE